MVINGFIKSLMILFNGVAGPHVRLPLWDLLGAADCGDLPTPTRLDPARR